MSNFLQLSVKLLVCGYYGAFQTLRTAIRTCKDVSLLYNKQEKYFKKEEAKQRVWKEIAKELDLEKGKLVEQLWKNVKSVLTQKRLFCFLFFFLTPSTSM